jgi:hypothetical protein
VGSHELEAMGSGNGLKRQHHKLYAKVVKGGPGVGRGQEVGVRGSSLIMCVSSLTSRLSEEEYVCSRLTFLVSCLLVGIVARLVGVVVRWCLRFNMGSWMG